MDLNLDRGSELSREQRTIPADLYNNIHIQFTRGTNDCLFVPIRTMQYLAVIDNDEIVFVDGLGPRTIEISWCDFKAGKRIDLRAPVEFTCIYYHEKGREIMKRMQVELHKALIILKEKQPKSPGATITPLGQD